MTIKESWSRGSENAYIRSTNALKYLYNKVRGRTVWHYRLVPERDLSASESFERLNRELRFDELKGLLNELSYIESQTTKITRVKKDVEKLYFKLGPYAKQDFKRVSSHIGPIPVGDIPLPVFEFKLFINGTTNYDYTTEKFTDAREMEFKIVLKNIPDMDPIKVIIPFPKIIKVPFPDGSVHNLSIYGRKKNEAWKNVYEKFLMEQIVGPSTKKLFKHYEDKLSDNPDKLEQIKINLQNNLEVINTGIKNTIDLILNKFTLVKEQAYEEFLKTETFPLFNALSKIKTQTLGECIPQKVKYKHTYKIIKIKRYIYDLANPRIEEFKDLHKNFHKNNMGSVIDGEIEPGIDKNGWPLEVDDEHGSITGTPFTVLLDFWEHRHIRIVKPEWVEDCDFLDIVCWLTNEWDEYRDDLRDGRYHPGSLTAIDYAMAINPTLWGEWKGKRENKLSEKYQKYEMKGQEPTTTGTREIPIKDRRKPTHLSPAFDKKAIRTMSDWVHIGKKRYYENNEHINEVIVL